MRKYLARFVALGMLLVLPSLGRAQSTTDRSEMDQWVKDTANQGADPWRQDHDGQLAAVQAVHAARHAEAVYRQVLLEDAAGCRDGCRPGGLQHLPAQTWVEATEKYGPQTQVEVLPNGHYVLKNYHGGTLSPIRRTRTRAGRFWPTFSGRFMPSVYVEHPE